MKHLKYLEKLLGESIRWFFSVARRSWKKARRKKDLLFRLCQYMYYPFLSPL